MKIARTAATPDLSRRQFMISSAAAAGGLAVGFSLPTGARAQSAAGTEVDAWVVIKPDDSCVVRIQRTEMGQGTRTGIAQLVAEELDCDWSKVSTEQVTPQDNLARKRVWGEMITVGSRGIRFSHEAVRRGGAAARTLLLQAAANEWNVPVAELSVDKGVIRHAASNRVTSYGKVAAAAAKLPAPDAKSLKLKNMRDWKIAGKALKRVDTAPKLDGSMVYAIDVKLPGLLNAAIKDCPVFGGKLASFDGAKALTMPGVRSVIRVDASAVAVVADTWWHAKRALDEVKIVWDEGPNASESSATIAARLADGLVTQDKVHAFRKEGDALKAIESAAKKVEGTYSTPFLNHATMEPMNCTARVSADRAEVWVATQDLEGAHLQVAKTSGLPIEKCFVHRYDPGGGFGRRGRVSDFARQAVDIAKQFPDVPIKMIWTREEDMTHGQYRPISQCKFTAGLDAQNNLVGMHVRMSGQSINAWVNPSAIIDGYKDDRQLQGWYEKGDQQLGYTVPNLLIEYAIRNTHVPVGTWRGVNVPQNGFYMECFIDEVARTVGVDAVEFRRGLMRNHPKHLEILNLAAERGNWGKPLPKGVFRGVAQFMSYDTYSAAVAEVSVTPDGAVRVHKLLLAANCGHAVNPGQIEAQVQGSIVYGLSAALWGENTVEKGRMVQTNFHDYRVLQLSEMPKVETIVVANGDFWGGIGEPTIAVVAPAVVNAVSAAIGRPVRDLPLKNQKLA